MRELSAEEHQVLQELYHRTPEAAIKTRCQILVLSAKPMSVPQIAQISCYSEDTVARCIHECNQRRLESLLPGPKGGRPPKSTPDSLKWLLSIIEQDPQTQGCAFSNWTAPLLAAYLKHLRRTVTHNALFQTTDRLLEAVTICFQDLTAHPDIVRSVAGLTA